MWSNYDMYIVQITNKHFIFVWLYVSYTNLLTINSKATVEVKCDFSQGTVKQFDTFLDTPVSL